MTFIEKLYQSAAMLGFVSELVRENSLYVHCGAGIIYNFEILNSGDIFYVATYDGLMCDELVALEILSYSECLDIITTAHRVKCEVEEEFANA